MATLRQRLLMRLVNLYPPYLGAGVRVSYPKDEPHRIVVRLGLHWWNKNLFGTQFGGSLYAMCDPHFVFIVIKNLGPGYLVWNKAAQIEFLRPGRGPVTARRSTFRRRRSRRSVRPPTAARRSSRFSSRRSSRTTGNSSRASRSGSG